MTRDLKTSRLLLTYEPDVEVTPAYDGHRCGVYYLRLAGSIAGAVSLTSVSRGHGEIGYEINPDHQGQGLATEAVAAVVAHCLNAHGFSMLTARARADNLPSRRVLEKAGFGVAACKLCWPDDNERPVLILTFARFAPDGVLRVPT